MLTRVIPGSVLACMYSDWPAAQRTVLRSLVSSPATVYNCLSMADEEMKTITSLDEALLKRNRKRLYMYFAEDDGWVGEQKQNVLRALDGDEGVVKVVHGHPDIPHAFCISKYILPLDR